MRATWAPSSFTVVPDAISGLTLFGELSGTQTAGVNVPTSIPAGFTRPAGQGISPTGGPEDGHGGGIDSQPIPTQYLAQLPPRWPYTSYGAARRPDMLTSWALTNPNISSQTVGWVYASLLWDPRPLYTPPAAAALRDNDGGLAYDPLLEGWTHAFGDGDGAAGTSAAAAAASSASSLPSPSASSSIIKTTTMTTGTTAGTTAGTTTGTETLQTESQSLAPLLTPSQVWFGTDPTGDVRAEGISEASSSRSNVDAVANLAVVVSSTVTAVTVGNESETGLSELWDEVTSLKSRLGA